MMAPIVESGGVGIWAGVWKLESGGWFCVDAFGRNLALVAVKMFLHLVSLTKTFYVFSAFMRFSIIMLEQTVLMFKTKGSFPSTLMGMNANI
jgi:hypothetical protein